MSVPRADAEMELNRKSRGGFTLIELFVVITVLAILMALLFPAFKGVQDQAKRTQAKNNMTQIVTAVGAYYTEYGKMPVDDAKQGFDTLVGDPNGSYDNAYVFDIMRAIPDSNWNRNNQYNPKQINFFSGPDAKSATAPRSGFATKDTTVNGVSIKKGALLDPWGNEYLVGLDSDYDSWTQQFFSYADLPYTTKSGGAGDWPAVQANATASSWGKDSKFGNGSDSKYNHSDDVISWQ